MFVTCNYMHAILLLERPSAPRAAQPVLFTERNRNFWAALTSKWAYPSPGKSSHVDMMCWRAQVYACPVWCIGLTLNSPRQPTRQRWAGAPAGWPSLGHYHLIYDYSTPNNLSLSNFSSKVRFESKGRIFEKQLKRYGHWIPLQIAARWRMVVIC